MKKNQTKKDPYINIKSFILGNMILVPLIPFIMALWIGHYYFTTALETNTISSLKRIVRDHRQMIDYFLSERKADLEFIRNLYSIDQLSNADTLKNIFQHLQHRSNAFVDIGVFNEQGVHVAYYGSFKLTGMMYKHTEWFKQVEKNGYYISDIFSGYRGVPHFIIAIAGKTAEGKLWIIRSTIDSLTFNDLVEKVRIGKTGEAYLLNSEGILQTGRRSGGALMEIAHDNLSFLETHDDIKTFIQSDEKQEYLYATTWLKDKHWMLVVRQERSDAFKYFYSAVYMIVWISIFGAIIIISVAWYMTSRIVKRMKYIDTEKDRLNLQLIRASRLAEVGEMAAGFAHEINNPLQIIKNEITLIEDDLADLKQNSAPCSETSTTELEDCISQIKSQINRCAKITQAILKFGRQSEPVPEDVKLQAFIPDVTSMIAKKASVHGITVKLDISQELPILLCDPGQLQQVFINLFNNAIDAIIEKHGSLGGLLIIKAIPAKDNKIEISIIDNGCGIKQENLKKIFTPFYTSKPVGKGTGLGLSVCFGIMDSMGGSMEVNSEENVGTSFTLKLPAKGI
jgi:two-component system NtrC family sensor kinase